MTKQIPAQSSSQPSADPKFLIYGGKKAIPTIRVKDLASDKEMIVNQKDFDPAKHERLD